MREEYLSNLNPALGINELISRYGSFRTSFYRLYAELFHASPKNDLIWSRLNRAKEFACAEPKKKMYEIAAECGFNDVRHFFGCSRAATLTLQKTMPGP